MGSFCRLQAELYTLREFDAAKEEKIMLAHDRNAEVMLAMRCGLEFQLILTPQ